MVMGGSLCAGAACAAGAAGSRGTASVTTLVARVLGAGRSPCCAGWPVSDAAVVRVAIMIGRERQRMVRTVASGGLENEVGKARIYGPKFDLVASDVHPSGETRTHP